MAEYIEREAFLEKMKKTSRYFAVKFDIEEFPATDVVEVCRCKDCRLSKPSVFGENWRFCKNNCQSHRDDHFCGYGERRGEDALNRC